MQKKKMSLSRIGKPGPVFSEEAKFKMSNSRKGINFSDEHRENISKSALNRTPWNKGKKHVVLKNKKPIYQCDLSGQIIKEWVSAIDIFQELGYSRSSISSCCSGRYSSSYGFIWKYKQQTK